MIGQIEELLERVGTNAHVRAAFGEPYEIDGRLLIPVARVQMGLGLGGGRGRARPDADAEATEGEGGGGGGMMSVKPVAVIEVAGERVRMVPIVDVGRIVLGAMLLAGWAVFWVTRTVRAVAAKAAKRGDG